MLRKFRTKENPNSISFNKNLNELVKQCKKIESAKGYGNGFLKNTDNTFSFFFGKKGKGTGGGGNTVSIAYCKTDSPDSDEIQCYLDTDETGTEVTVKCLIINGTSLMHSAPFLNDGDPVWVTEVSVGGTTSWYIIGLPFNGAFFG